MVIGKIVYEGIRYGSRYFPKTIFAIKRADVRIHKSLYGASGGKGVRHGRDIGSAAAGLYQGTRPGDDLGPGESDEPSTGFTSYKQPQARRRYNISGRRKRRNYCRPRNPNRQSRYYSS